MGRRTLLLHWWEYGLEFAIWNLQDMWMYISEDKSFNDFGNEKALVWHETNIPYAIWSPEGSRRHRILYDPSEVLVLFAFCVHILYYYSCFMYDCVMISSLLADFAAQCDSVCTCILCSFRLYPGPK